MLSIGLLLYPMVATASVAASSGEPASPLRHEAIEAVRWGAVIGIGVEAVILLALALASPFVRTLVIGQDGRVSTSKTVAFVWTLVVAAALFAIVYADFLNHSKPLDATNNSGVVGQYALLFGGPLGAAILAKQIVTKQVSQDPTRKPGASSPSPTDLVSDDSNNTDLGDLQYVLFNIVALAFVIGTFLHNPIAGLPKVPDVLLGLTSVSAVGYVGKKALVPTGLATASLAPRKGATRTEVTISVAGLSPADQPEAKLWVQFGADPGWLQDASVVAGEAQIKCNAPSLSSPPERPVPVRLVTPNGTVIKAGTFTYT